MSKTWNGNIKTFPEFRSLLEGFLLQVGVGYLLEKNVRDGYRALGESYFSTENFYERYGVSQAQVSYDKSYLYGILLTTNRKNSSCPIIEDPRYRADCDGILCWEEFCNRYMYNGDRYEEVNALEEKLHIPYVSSPTTSSLRSFLDRYETNTYVLQSILSEIESPLSDQFLKRSLLKCLRPVSDIRHLVQNVRDSVDLTFRDTVVYLRKNIRFSSDTEIT